MDKVEVQNIVRAVIQAGREPVMLEALCQVFKDYREVGTSDVQEAIEVLLNTDDPVQELRRIAGGYRYQIKQKYVRWIRQTQDREIESEPFPRALSEVLAIIAYRQPVSRGEIELIRAKNTSTSVFEQLLERQWIKIVAYGGESKRAALYGTTKEFLAYFGLNSIEDLPTVEKIIEMDAQASITCEI